MAPGKVCKMKQVCTASPSKFAAALLDILDGSVEDSPLPGMKAPLEPSIPEGKIKQARKRSASAMSEPVEAPTSKKAKTGQLTKAAAAPKKSQKGQLVETNIANQRRKELRAMSLPMIKQTALKKGLDVAGKEKMIDAILKDEARSRANVRRHKDNAKDVLLQKRQEFSQLKNKQLMELMRAYALQTKGTKPQRVERLLATWKEQGEIEKVLAAQAFKARKTELMGMDKQSLYALCVKKGVDALSKDVLVDRLLIHESVDIWQEVVEARRQLGGA